MHHPPRNIGLDIIRVTEMAALAASRWVGSGDYENASLSAYKAMADTLEVLGLSGRIIISEQQKADRDALLASGHQIGNLNDSGIDLAVDPIDGTTLLIKGRPGAMSFMGVAPRGAMWSPQAAKYMNKIVVDREAADALVPECMDAPAAWTLALVARVKQKPVHDLTILILSRTRHEELIDEVRTTGARILLQEEGDVEGALLAAAADSSVDLLMGIGGASQGVLSACAVRSLGGGMLARLAPQSIEEQEAVNAAGMDTQKVYTCHDLVNSNEVFFAATGITESPLLRAIHIQKRFAHTYSLLVRAQTNTRRYIHTEHSLEHLPFLTTGRL